MLEKSVFFSVRSRLHLAFRLVFVVCLGMGGAQGRTPGQTGAEGDEVKAPGEAPWLDLRQWRLELRSDIHSDALQLRYFGQSQWADQVSARSGRNLVQVDQSARVAVGSSVQGHQVAWLWRQMGRLVMTEDTARRMTQIDRGLHDSQDWHWNPQLRFRGFSGEGLDWIYRSLVAPGWSWASGVQVLQLDRLYGRDLLGQVAYRTEGQRYSFDAHSTQVDSRLALPFQRPVRNAGEALLLSGRLAWQGASMGVVAGVRDLGWLRWRGVPQRELNLNSNTAQRDAQGFVIYKPLIEGQNSQPSLRWQAPWTFDGAVVWNVGSNQQFSVMGDWLPSFGWLPSLRWSDASGPVHWSTQWRQHQGEMLLQLEWKGWSVALSSQNFSRTAQGRVLNLAYAQRF